MQILRFYVKKYDMYIEITSHNIKFLEKLAILHDVRVWFEQILFVFACVKVVCEKMY